MDWSVKLDVVGHGVAALGFADLSLRIIAAEDHKS